jgi:hypothetical protein
VASGREPDIHSLPTKGHKNYLKKKTQKLIKIKPMTEEERDSSQHIFSTHFVPGT